MSALLLTLNILNALLFATAVMVLIVNWKAHTLQVGKIVLTLVVASFLVLAAMIFVKGSLPYMQKWGAAFGAVGFLSNYLERRYYRCLRAGGHP
ncbi:hypothetical protein [Pseudoxanthomonas sp. Root630]|uniref:hypothetical protein n=1 Tax=Pseudoxanthomonas sp. Root630 TaxID=1736574 RepID=UPI0007028772|nr:hypothetical protein [Pseudoxanthomonas sp. Root630]KRA51688.1 hypothetical protein ASD72_00895 [Pseudoxanthomonas sp. Root630]